MSRLYFAAGPSLASPTSLKAREPGARPLELGPGTLAVLPHSYFTYDVASGQWGGRIARIVSVPGRAVHGRVFTVPDLSRAELDAIERSWLGDGATLVKRQVTAGGARLEVESWMASASPPAASGPVSVAFARALVEAARLGELPEPYLVTLAAEVQILEVLQPPPAPE